MGSLVDFLVLFRLTESYWLLLHLFCSATFSISTSIHWHGLDITCLFLGRRHFLTCYKTGTVSPHFTPEILLQRKQWMNDNLLYVKTCDFFVRPMVVSIYLTKCIMAEENTDIHWFSLAKMTFERFDKLWDKKNL